MLAVSRIVSRVVYIIAKNVIKFSFVIKEYCSFLLGKKFNNLCSSSTDLIYFLKNKSKVKLAKALCGR